jgi:hypothetical protein
MVGGLSRSRSGEETVTENIFDMLHNALTDGYANSLSSQATVSALGDFWQSIYASQMTAALADVHRPDEGPQQRTPDLEVVDRKRSRLIIFECKVDRPRKRRAAAAGHRQMRTHGRRRTMLRLRRSGTRRAPRVVRRAHRAPTRASPSVSGGSPSDPATSDQQLRPLTRAWVALAATTAVVACPTSAEQPATDPNQQLAMSAHPAPHVAAGRSREASAVADWIARAKGTGRTREARHGEGVDAYLDR